MAQSRHSGFIPSARAAARENVKLARCRRAAQKGDMEGRAPWKKSRGVSLLELLVVLVIILSIAALTIPSLLASIQDAKVAKAAGDMRTIQEEITLYQNTYQALPDDLSQVGYAGYLDPWGNPYQYYNLITLKGNGMARVDRFLLPLNEDYELYSMGRDGSSSPPLTAPNSLDDVVRAGNGSYVGLGSLY